MEVILIRHTRPDVPPGTCYGQTDVPLAASFPQEAARTKTALEAYAPFDHAYSSPLTRALRLAAFCGYPDATTDDRLLEIDMGQWEMQRYDEITDPALQRWYEDYLHLPATGGESFVQLYDRVASFLDELKQRPFHRVAVFAHSGVLMAAGIYGGLFRAEDAMANDTDFGGIKKIRL